jgi:hypothetical protein
MAERSWTDAVTGASLLGGFNLVEYLEWITHRKTRINRSLTQFLHEATHHWCFDSLVGSAISQLLLRARRKALFADGKVTNALVADVTRAMVAETLLHPLAEGLALFAEFDIRPGRSTVESMSMTSTLICFGFNLKTERDRSEMALQALLQTTRRSAEHLDRKAGIYALPFECKGGYLAGYLATKGLWASMAASAPKLLDTDLFLAFLRSYVYDDAHLVLLLLESDPEIEVVGTTVVNHMQERFRVLIECKTHELRSRVDDWEQACASGAPIYAAIGVDLDTARRANDAIHMLMDDIDDDGAVSEFAAHAYMTARNRQYLTLGRLEATARRVETGTEIAGPEGTRVCFAVTDWQLDGPARSGQLIAVLAYRERLLQVYFQAEGHTQLVHQFGLTGDIDAEEARNFVTNLALNDQLHANLEEALAQLMADPALQVWEQESRDSLLDVAEHLYGILGTLQTDSEQIPTVLAKLRTGGLLELLDGDVDLVKAIALIGLANTVGSDSVSIALFAGVGGLDDALIARARESAARRHGMHLLQLTPQGGAIALV